MTPKGRQNKRLEAFILVDRAMRLQLEDDKGDLSEIEACLSKALQLDPGNVDALQEAAHFYWAVAPKKEKSRRCVIDCIEQLGKLAAEMNSLLHEIDEESSLEND